MAEDKDLDLDTGGEEPKSKSKLLIIIIAVVVLLVGGGAAAFFLLMGGDEQPAEMDEAVENVKAKAIYIPLKPPFVVTYGVSGRQRFVQISVTLMTRNNDVVNVVQANMPLVRNNLVTVFSSQDFDELQTNEGKEALRQIALEEVQAIVEEEIGVPGVEQVLFTNFVMQ